MTDQTLAPRVVSDDELLATLDGLVADFGTDHHASCTYVMEDGPECIVGHVLHRLGVPLEALDRMEGDAFGQGDNSLWSAYVQMDEKQRHALRIAQVRQDTGSNWGTAVEAARSAMERW